MNLFPQSVSPTLIRILKDIMEEPIFKPFRLVGGTNIALKTNHRISTDIDLFTDYDYGTIDFEIIDQWFHNRYKYVECPDKSNS